MYVLFQFYSNTDEVDNLFWNHKLKLDGLPWDNSVAEKSKKRSKFALNYSSNLTKSSYYPFSDYWKVSVIGDNTMGAISEAKLTLPLMLKVIDPKELVYS